MGFRRREARITAACLAAVIPGIASSAVARRTLGPATALDSGTVAATEHISVTSASGSFRASCWTSRGWIDRHGLSYSRRRSNGESSAVVTIS